VILDLPISASIGHDSRQMREDRGDANSRARPGVPASSAGI